MDDFFKKILFICEHEREREHKHGAGEGEADSPLSREPLVGLDPRTVGSGPELEADA